MNENIMQAEKKFMDYVKKMTAYNEALSLIYWDMRTGAPKKGIEQRSEVVGVLSSEVFRMSTSEEMAAFIAIMTKKEVKCYLSNITKKTVEHCKKEYDRNRRIPADMHREYVILQSKAESVWEEARRKADFAMFQPYLEKLVEMNKRFIGYWGYKGNKYNTLLDSYEPGVTVELLDGVFAELRRKIVPLVKGVSDAKVKPDTSFLSNNITEERQRAFSIEILKRMGYDFEAGRLDNTVHPFAVGLNPGDVRITTQYDERDFRMAVFSTIHEGGHALYEQNIARELIGTPLCTGTSMGIHESQSLFYENFVGRNYFFWKKYYSLLNEYAGGQFSGVSLENFYRAINESKSTLIRIEADELTYPLHILIRYEIEKGFFNDEIKVAELPQIWNEKYQQYLGIKPNHDGEGVLQDVHWAGGNFGYFPSYALGYMYAAQFKNAMLKDIPHFDSLLEKGDLLPIKGWFNSKIHQFGKMKEPLEILKDVTGEELNPTYLIDYLYRKYCSIYGL